MWISLTKAKLELPPKRALRLRPERGTTLRVLAGTVWLTIDHDQRDLVLGPGDRHVVDGREPLLAMALGGPPACLELDQPADQRSPMMAAVASSSSNSASITRPGTA